MSFDLVNEVLAHNAYQQKHGLSLESSEEEAEEEEEEEEEENYELPWLKDVEMSHEQSSLEIDDEEFSNFTSSSYDDKSSRLSPDILTINDDEFENIDMSPEKQSHDMRRRRQEKTHRFEQPNVTSDRTSLTQKSSSSSVTTVLGVMVLLITLGVFLFLQPANKSTPMLSDNT